MAAKKISKKMPISKKKAAPKAVKKPATSAKPAASRAKTVAQPEFEIRKTRIKIIGLGGGGSNIVAGIASKIKKASFCIVNTDYQALAHSIGGVPTFQFGQKFTQGLGTGMDPALAEEAARDEREKIKKMLEGNDLVILVASLGGGTGSGAAPVFAQVSKSLGNLTYGIFTMPFAFEGSKKEEIAKNALERTRPYLSALSILPNERVFLVVPKTTPFAKTMAFINDNLSRNLQGLIEMIYEPGMINIDFADVRTVLSGQGKLAFLNAVEFEKKEGVDVESFENAFASPLYPYAVDRARGLLINVGGQKDLKLSEVNKILTGINARIHKDAKIILGVSQAQAAGGVKVTVLATGCASNGGSPEAGAAASESQKEKSASAAKAKPADKNRAGKKIKKGGRKPFKKNKTGNFGKTSKNEGAKEVKISLPKAEKTDEEYVIDAGKYDSQNSEVALRKSAVEVHKEVEREEKEMLDKEKAWEIPAFLRRKKK